MTTKIAVSLPDELVEEARQAVKDGRAKSVSAYVADALRQSKREGELERLLDDMDRELGPPSKEAFDWARRVMGK